MSSRNNQDFRKCVFSICGKLLAEHPEYRVFIEWEEIVGSVYAKMCTPYKILPSKTLWLDVEYGAMLDIQYASMNILNLLRIYLGRDYFTNLKLSNKKTGKNKQKSSNIFTKKEFNIGDSNIEEELNKLWNSIK